MSDKHEEIEKIPCHVCKTLIPKSAAVNAEGEEYVMYFCDIGCLDYWEKEEKKDVKEKESSE